MPRSLVVGNGNLLVNFDTEYNIRDIYYPHVGMENHTTDCLSRCGVWIDDNFSWLDSPKWEKDLLYEDGSLLTNAKVFNPEVGLALNFTDLVDAETDIFIRQVRTINHQGKERDVRLFFHYQMRILGNGIGDTVYYHPRLKALVLYKYRRYFLAGGHAVGEQGISDWSMGSMESDNGPGIVLDPKDGRLERIPLACGFVEGIVGINAGTIPASGESTIYHWLAASTHFHGIEDSNALVQELGPESFIERTRRYWQSWLGNHGDEPADTLPSTLDLYRRSMLVMRAQTDNQGAIVASSDSDIVDRLMDTYANMWARDGAFIAMALDMAGFSEVTDRFFNFCQKAITSDGYFLQKYAPDGSLAGQWMPWANEHGGLQLPIQEDETALIIHSLWLHYTKYKDDKFLSNDYIQMIKRAADFMVAYREPHTNLPAPSYDLWEERRAIHSFTVATVWAALQAATSFMELLGENSLVEKYQQATVEIKEAAIKYLYSHRLGRFIRSITVKSDGTIEPEETLDSSLSGLFILGMLPATDPLIENTMNAVINRLWCRTATGGMARYEDDHYHQVSQDITNIPGNPWFVCTMWVADYHIARAKSHDELQPALDILNWTSSCALPSGVLAEQIHPETCTPLSVSPLTWSHAAFVITVNKYIRKYKELATAVK